MSESFQPSRQSTPSTQSIKILCLGQQQVGKSSFLSDHVENNSYTHIKDSPCQVFLKRYTNSFNRRVWVEFYQLSNTYPEYLGCYMLQKYEAIIFFYDMTDKKSRNRLNLWLRLLEEFKKSEVWSLPVLLIGLKKNLLFSDECEQVIKDVKNQFHRIFSEKSFLYFGEDIDQEKKNSEHFDIFVKRVISKKYKDSTQWEKYKLIQSYHIYNYMYTYWEILKISAEVMMQKAKGAVEAMNLGGLVERASEVYVRLTDKLSHY